MTVFFSVPDQTPADAFSNMLFSYMIFFSLFITFSFAAPSYVDRDKALILGYTVYGSPVY